MVGRVSEQEVSVTKVRVDELQLRTGMVRVDQLDYTSEVRFKEKN
jgi:hypothetical protein